MSEQHLHREAPPEVAAPHESATPNVAQGATSGALASLGHPTAVIDDVIAPARWPRRRRVAAVVLLAGLVVLVGATAGWPLSEAPLWTVLTAGTVVISSLALALFVPRSGGGWRPDLGCAPCAVAGLAVAVAAPWLIIETAPQVERAALALVIAGAGLARKLTEPAVCERP